MVIFYVSYFGHSPILVWLCFARASMRNPTHKHLMAFIAWCTGCLWQTYHGMYSLWYHLGVVVRGSLQWRHNGCDGVSNHQPHHCFLNRLFRHRWMKTSKLRVTGHCAANSLVTGWPVNSPHKRPDTQKMSPFDDVIILSLELDESYTSLKEISYTDQWSVLNYWFDHLVNYSLTQYH